MGCALVMIKKTTLVPIVEQKFWEILGNQVLLKVVHISAKFTSTKVGRIEKFTNFWKRTREKKNEKLLQFVNVE